MDRKVFDWRSQAVPFSAIKGHLAESWETPDATTIIFDIRQGVRWHDKAPVNGRALTAKDVEDNFHRSSRYGRIRIGPTTISFSSC